MKRDQGTKREGARFSAPVVRTVRNVWLRLLALVLGSLLLLSALVGCWHEKLVLEPSRLVLSPGAIAGVAAYLDIGRSGENGLPQFLSDAAWEVDGATFVSPSRPSSCAIKAGSKPGTYSLRCRATHAGKEFSEEVKLIVAEPAESVRLLEVSSTGKVVAGGSSPLLKVRKEIFVTSVSVTLVGLDAMPFRPPGPSLTFVDVQSGNDRLDYPATVGVIRGRRTVLYFQPQTSFSPGTYVLDLGVLNSRWATNDEVGGDGLCTVDAVKGDW
jgi:hypothetical protein